MKVRLWPYKLGSAGCKALQAALQEEGIDCKRVRSAGRYVPRREHVIINWGNSTYPHWPWAGRVLLNHPTAVTIAANKLRTFQRFTEANIQPRVSYTTSREIAKQDILDGFKIYCRTKLSGHSGEGIVVARTIEELVDAPLYTVGIDVKGEYRVHVFRSPEGEYKIVDVTKKRRRNEALENESLNMDVRNLVGGWVFAHSNVDIGDDVKVLACRAVEALGLDFGAVDIVVEKRTDTPYVLEVNCAPGLSSPTTISAYVEAIKCYLER